jgi:hypothetical protein
VTAMARAVAPEVCLRSHRAWASARSRAGGPPPGAIFVVFTSSE